jgi:hypothetical protein
LNQARRLTVAILSDPELAEFCGGLFPGEGFEGVGLDGESAGPRRLSVCGSAAGGEAQ